MLFIEGLLDRDELVAAGAAVPETPKLANLVSGGKTPMLPRRELHEIGYAIVLYANAALQAAVRGTQEVMSAVRADGDLSGVTDRLATFTERQRLVRKERFDKIDSTYAG